MSRDRKLLKSSTVRMLLALAVIGVQGLLLYSFLRSGEPDAGAIRKAAAAKPLDISAGVPDARRRIDDFIANVAGYDFAECSASLHGPTSVDEAGETDLVLHAGFQSGDFNPSLRFWQVLADRRVAKLYERLNEMPREDAARTARVLFDEKLRIHQSAWVRGMENLRRKMRGEAKLPEVETENLPIRYRSTCHNLHALSASLFLCAGFCPSHVVLEKCDRWYATIKPIREEVFADPELSYLGPHASMCMLPETLFLLNVYALSFDRHGCGSVDQLLDVVRKRDPRADPKFEKEPFYAWNAHTNAADFTHLHGFVPTDDSRILTRFWMARRWGSLASNEARQDEVLAAARALLEECTDRKQ